MQSAQLLDERSRPDFREVYGFHAARAGRLDAAVNRIRLGGMTLGRKELGSLEAIRLLIGEVNALTLASEAQSLAIDPSRRTRLELMLSLLGERRLQVRIAPLASWSPDFSVFSGAARTPDQDGAGQRSPVLMIGMHWFERPYPHPGPALGIVLVGGLALRARERFEELWGGAHGLAEPITSVLQEALWKADGAG